jgi:hypothetical protein
MKAKRVNTLTASRKDYPHLDSKIHPNGVTEKEYAQIIHLFCKKLSKKLITTGDQIRLPHTLGSLKIVQYLKGDDLL